MKGKKPTRDQRYILTKHNLDTHEWLVQKNTQEHLQVVHKTTNEIRVLDK